MCLLRQRGTVVPLGQVCENASVSGWVASVHVCVSVLCWVEVKPLLLLLYQSDQLG